MKKILLFVFATILSVSMLAQGGDLDNQFYFRFGLSMPTWKYYGYNGKDDVKTDFGNDVRRSGFIFELGSIFMLNSIPLADGMRLGINADYLSAGVNILRGTSGAYDLRLFNYYLGSKLGPSFSYSPVKNLTFDIYGKVNPVWFTLVTNITDYPNDESTTYGGFLDFKYSAGFNIRYAILMLGLEYNLGSTQLEMLDTDAPDNTFLGNLGDNPNTGDKTSMPAVNITLGLSF